MKRKDIYLAGCILSIGLLVVSLFNRQEGDSIDMLFWLGLLIYAAAELYNQSQKKKEQSDDK